MVTQKHFKVLTDFIRVNDIKQKTKYKSLFLDKYDNHFTAAQYNYIIYNLGRLLQNFAPDATPIQPVSDIHHYNALGNQFLQERTSPFELSVGSTRQTPTSKRHMLRIIVGLRYRNQLPLGNNVLATPYRIYGNGYLVAGRHPMNIARRLR